MIRYIARACMICRECEPTIDTAQRYTYRGIKVWCRQFGMVVCVELCGYRKL